MTSSGSAGRVAYLYVAGSGHSGSTLLAFLLNSHPEIFAIGEAHASRLRTDPDRRVCSCGEPMRACPFFKEQASRFARAGIDFDPAFWTIDYAIEGRPRLSRLLLRSLRSTPLESLRGHVLRSLPAYRRLVAAIDQKNILFVRNALEITGKSIFADASKDPFRIYHLRRIPAFRLLVLHLVRDPRAVVYSFHKRHASHGPSQRLYHSRRIASLWVRTQANVHRQIRPMPPGTSLVVRYEDLCAEAAKVLERIGDLAGVGSIERPDDFRSSEHHIMGNVMREGRDGVSRVTLDEAWVRGLTAEEQATVMRVAGEAAQRYGYAARPIRA